MTLPSNVINQHNSNTIGDYVTQLPETLHLNSDWKVGLCEIHYTNSWYNLKKSSEIKIEDSDHNELMHSIKLPPGRYATIDALVSEIKKRLWKSSSIVRLPVMSYDIPSQKFRMKFGQAIDVSHPEVMLNFGENSELANMLGTNDGFELMQSDYLTYLTTVPGTQISKLPEEQFWIESSWLDAKHSYDLSGGINSLYVYSDVVDYGFVGNTKARLLRVVKVPSSATFGEQVSIIYQKPYFMPLATKDISQIRITVRDDSGELIDFRFGRVEVTLQFIKNG